MPSKTKDVCERPFCPKCQLHHNGMCYGPNEKRIGWCYRHDTAHAPLKSVNDLREEMD